MREPTEKSVREELEQVKADALSDISKFLDWLTTPEKTALRRAIDKAQTEPYSAAATYDTNGSFQVAQSEVIVGLRAWTNTGSATISPNNVLPFPVTTTPINIPWGTINSVGITVDTGTTLYVQFYNEPLGRMV